MAVGSLDANEHAVAVEPPVALETTLATWREQGAHRLAPLRFAFIEALTRRAAAHHGDARRLLDEKLARAVAAYDHDLKTAPTRAAGEPEALPPHRSALATLRDHLTASSSNHHSDTTPLAWHTAPQQASASAQKTLAHLRKTWTQLSAAHRVKQALASTPPKAGPLNSQQLVHRALLMMREVSPDYLQHFVATLDALSWAEQLHSSNAPASTTTASTASRSKLARGKA